MIIPEGNQRWGLGRDSYRPAGEVIRPSEYDVQELTGDDADNQAKEFIQTHHYSAAYPSARFRFALARHGRRVGMAVFSHPMNDRTLTNVFPVHRREACELGRLVLLDEVPGNAETWFLARCFDALRQKKLVDKDGNPALNERTGAPLRGILGVVSFSDPVPRRTIEGRTVLPGHVGTIYQALNGCYLGRADSRTLRLLPDGTIYSHRDEMKVRNKESGWVYCVKELREYGAGPLRGESKEDLRAWLVHWLPLLTRPLPHKGNHKYAWAVRRDMRRHLPNSKAYPKRIDVVA
jgi:hypothetical protein